MFKVIDLDGDITYINPTKLCAMDANGERTLLCVECGRYPIYVKTKEPINELNKRLNAQLAGVMA